jgi:hypothetical protein
MLHSVAYYYYYYYYYCSLEGTHLNMTLNAIISKVQSPLSASKFTVYLVAYGIITIIITITSLLPGVW